MKRIGLFFVLVVLLAVPIAVAAEYDYPNGGGSGGGGGSSGGGIQVGGGGSQSSGGHVGGSDVTIVDFAYQRGAIFINSGETVEWSNAGNATHTVDSNAGVFESGDITSGGRYRYTFDDRGVYAYHCEFHSNMRGMVVVS